MILGKQTIELHPYCMSSVVSMHEIGHAVGFFHEHSRNDRDDHVEIVWENIHKDKEHSYRKKHISDSNNYGILYDYTRMMHGKKNLIGKLAIKTEDKTYQDKISRYETFSFYDIKLANLMCECNESCAPDIVCPGEGFVGKDCKCYCQGRPK
ncbi:metalloendopeptidase [Elysia marginata]|uniref:Metalloendopeptidase n=1 Tax=Elysia marginata TaxID=1093978 RepID=A0AAV4ESZ0_9GAST|nr:metalloendopeptidase [Elysia marginata]